MAPVRFLSDVVVLSAHGDAAFRTSFPSLMDADSCGVGVRIWLRTWPERGRVAARSGSRGVSRACSPELALLAHKPCCLATSHTTRSQVFSRGPPQRSFCLVFRRHAWPIDRGGRRYSSRVE